VRQLWELDVGGSNPSTPTKDSADLANSEAARDSDKRTEKPHSGAEAAREDAKDVVALPPGQVSLADVLAAVDDALIAGDVHRARRLNALAREMQELGLVPKSGAR
jgi:hypothetical protein